MSSSSDWMGVVAAMENSFTRIAQLRQGPGFLFAAEDVASKSHIQPFDVVWRERLSAPRVFSRLSYSGIALHEIVSLPGLRQHHLLRESVLRSLRPSAGLRPRARNDGGA